MSPTLLLAFVAACVVLGLTPGPNMSLIVANTLSNGLRAGLFTLLGCFSGLAVLMTVTALGMSSVMTLMADWFDVVRWAGAVYLIWLGFLQLRQAWRGSSVLVPRAGSGGSWYAQGLLVSLANPKVLLFLGAFLPQFLDPQQPAGPQLAILGVTFVVTLACVDVAYTVALARARRTFTVAHFRWLDGLAGGLLLAGGAVLATLRRP